jgi:hypothetical protein
MAQQIAPAVIGWKPGGWVLYDPRHGAPAGITPEIFIAGQRCWPIALTETGREMLTSALIAIVEDK